MMFDEQRVLLRATWRPSHGFFNLSLWRDERVVETFHLAPEAAANLVGFISRAFASSLPMGSSADLRVVTAAERSSPAPSARRLATRLRLDLADSLEAAARRLRR